MKRHDEIFKKMFDRDENRIPYEKKYLNETIGELTFLCFLFHYF